MKTNNTTKEIEMTFPYIGKNKHGVKALIYSRNSARILSGECAGQMHDMSVVDNDWFKRKYENITADYLRNTYGKVASKEHAEFIVELAEVNNIRVAGEWVKDKLFCFASDCEGRPFLSFYLERSAKSDNEKLITLPLPPKESEEWPQVGDEVLICKDTNLLELHRFSGKQCEVIGICEHKNKKVLTLSHKSCGLAAMNMGDWIKKPPTPEEELAKELEQMVYDGMDNSYDLNHNCYYLVSGLVKKYDIKKKPD